MKTLLMLVSATFLIGCSKDYDDRAFFNTGWLKPEEGATRRMNGERAAGEEVKAGTPAPTKTAH